MLKVKQQKDLLHVKKYSAMINILINMVSPHTMFLSSLSGSEPVINQKDAADVQPAQTENVKKPNKRFVRQIDFITMPEFENIPQ